MAANLELGLYVTAVDVVPPRMRLAVVATLGVLVLSMTSIATYRLPGPDAAPTYEPYRESAQWIQTLPACREQLLPVVTTDDPEALLALASELGVPARQLGITGGESVVVTDRFEVPLGELRTAFEGTLPALFG